MADFTLAQTLEDKQKLTVEWFMEKAKDAADMREELFTDEDHERAAAATIIGRMYLFKYRAKGRKTLPYYDRYPLVIPIERYNNGFLGINFHYLPLRFRVMILGKLSEFATNKKYDETTRLRLSYQMLQAAKLNRFIRPMIKRYLRNHVRSQFIEMYMNEWPQAVMLPVQHFVTESGNQGALKQFNRGILVSPKLPPRKG